MVVMKKAKKGKAKQTAPSLFEEPVGELSPTSPTHQFADTAPVRIAMPDRGYLYSEAHRQDCELRQLQVWVKEMSAKEWKNLWELIEKYRGPSASYQLRYRLEELASQQN